MAKKFVDASVTDSTDDISIQDGTALTLTNAVRVLYDDTVTKLDLLNALEKAEEAIRRDLAPK